MAVHQASTSDVGRRNAALAKPGRLGRVEWRHLWPPLLLALLALLAAMLGQALRPSVLIDVGDYYDRLYLRGFHERETAPLPPSLEYGWPAGADELLIPAAHDSLRLGIVRLDPAPDEQGLDWGGALLYANGRRVATLRDSDDRHEYRFPVPETNGGPLRLTLEPEAETGTRVLAVRVESVTLSAAQTYRWSTAESSIRLPGIGRGAWQVALMATTSHPDGSLVAARLYANDSLLAVLPESGERRRYKLLVPARLAAGGDLELRLQANTFSDPRALGMLVEQLRVAPVGRAPLLPPWSTLLAMLTLGLSCYAGLARFHVPRWGAAAVAAAVLAATSLALYTTHGPMGYYLPRLAALGLGGLALALLLNPLIGWAFASAGVPLKPWLRDGLLLLFLTGFWLKAGAMLWPYFVGIDVAWHMERVRWVLDGRLAEMYAPGGFSESVMPASEWGDEKPLIPYSPFFHIFGTIFTLSPLPLVLTAHLASALFDTSRVFLVALLARKAGLGSRGALLCAALIAATPVTFLLHSWGNLPTTFGLWWAFASTTFLVAAYERLDRRWPFLVLTLMLTVTFLIYTVSGVFMGLFLLLLGTLLCFGATAQRRPALRVLWAMFAASGLALLIYYGQYIPPMIERTLPYFSQTIREGQAVVGLEQESFGEYLAKFPNRLDYSGRPLYHGLLIPLVLYLPALVLYRRRLPRALLASAWLIALLFTVVGLRVPMVDKQVYWLIPFAALAGGAVFARFWGAGRAGRVATVAFYLFTLAAALDLWVYRVANVQQ
jgi:hypothetical protein